VRAHRIAREGVAALTLVLSALLVSPASATSPSPDDPDVVVAEEVEAEQEVDRARPRFHGSAEVAASRIATDGISVGRRQVIMSREEIHQLPAQNLQELLTLIPGLGLTRRGARGVQGDLNLRGSTFEQALVLVNGVRVNNPQTGHHHLDLFIPLAAVERVEVLYGPGSAVHGPDAFGGAINIVTSQPLSSAYLRVGQNDLSGGGFSAALGAGLWATAEREVHTGFRDNTEADVNQLAAGWSWSGEETTVDLSLAVGSRDFGAHAFYSARFPDQRESTAGELLTLRTSSLLGSSTLGVSLRLDRHEDEFVLDRERPDWFRNTHNTRGGLLAVSLAGAIDGWDWAAGVEGARDEIESSNLGDHQRTRGALFAELGSFRGPYTLSLQARIDDQDPWGTEGTFAVGGSLPLGRGWRARAHYGSSFRGPSFTELYYSSPSRVGNPSLEPERGRTVEGGLAAGPWTLSLFHREADPIIDYLLSDDGVWRAHNIGEVRTTGIETELGLPVAGRLRWQRVGLVYLDSEIDVDPERSAYALAHPRAEATWTGSLEAGRGWTAGWGMRWRDPKDGGSWATVDLRVAHRFLDHLLLTLEASNLLDREITELHGVPLPGRWVTLTVAWRQR
jgi:iron complex outermembrane receptor protein